MTDENGTTTYAVATESGKDETFTELTNTYDLCNQLIKSVTEDVTISNTYNASGYCVTKSVTKSGKVEKTYFLYDGNNVIMEADVSGVTAKNTYGGPLLLRTVFSEDDSEDTYQYLYNAHGDVVTLLSGGEVVATYYYDFFGNILDQTGDVHNSILYAGYQYDEETGLYYINARMYDPVTARFLQADTYLGNTNDPLSLNLYTYCLNNPHKYIDPSGHFVLTATAALLIAKIGISLIVGIMSAKSEFDRQIAEGDNYTNWGSVLFVGAANAGIAYFTFGIGQGATAVAGAGTKALVKSVGKAIIRDAAIGALADAGVETARQLVTGTKITNLEYDRIAEAGVYGGITGGASTLAGAGLEGLAKSRVMQKTLIKVDLAANKGLDAIENSFAKVAKKNGKTVGMETVTELNESGFKMDLQRFASNSNSTNRVDTSLSLQQALTELDASGLRPGQTELHMSQLNNVLDAVKYNYNPTKAYSSVYSDGTNRYLVEGHHTTVAFKMLGKENAINMNTATHDVPSTTKVYWTRKWYQFWKRAIKIVED